MDRVPPHSPEAERAVLSACILSPDALALALDTTTPPHMYVESNRLIYQAMSDMFTANQAVDIVTLVDHLVSTGRLDAAGGPSAVSNLAGQYVGAGNVEHWARIISDKARLRAVITEATRIVHEAYNEPDNVPEFLDKANGSMFAISAGSERKRGEWLSSALGNLHDSIPSTREKPTRVPGIRTPWNALNKILYGFRNQMVYILAAGTSHGKTSLAIQVAYQAAIDGLTVAFFSLETSNNALSKRIVSAQARIPSHLLLANWLNPESWTSFTKLLDGSRDLRIWLEDEAKLTPTRLRAKARRLKSAHGLDLVVVDYLQLLTPDTRYQVREREVAEISKALRIMASDLDVPVLALSQFNREFDKQGREPKLSDLRESGSLEQDAYAVMLLHRPEQEEMAKLNVAKHKDGPTGSIDLRWRKEFMRFEE